MPRFSLEAIGEENLEMWIETEMASWCLPPQAREMRLKQGRLYINDAGFKSYIAKYNNEPVGICGSKFCDDGVLFLQGAAVRPELRKKGFYRAMIGARILDAASDHGVKTVLVNALSTTSAPLLAKCGFEKFCELQHYFMVSVQRRDFLDS